MPSLSQNLTFTIDSATSVQLNYPNTGTSLLTYFSNPVKGEGYYNGTDGIHTIQINISQFEGKIEIQGSLMSQPTENDWFVVSLSSKILNENTFTIDTTGLISNVYNTANNLSTLNYTTPTSTTVILNLLGNFVWLRAKISDFNQGTISSIKYNF